MQTRDQLPTLLDELQKITEPHLFWNDWRMPFFRNDAAGVSVYENDDQIFLEAAVPGVKPDQIDISLEKGVIWIQAKAANEHMKGMKVHVATERKYSYRVPLPVKIDEHHPPQAECHDGILKVAVRKNQSSKPIKINVHSG